MPESSITPLAERYQESAAGHSSSAPPQVVHRGTASVVDREYEFFVTTEEPHQAEGVERGLIRRLVMRNFFETKWAGPRNNASEHSSANTVMAQRQLRNRFRLSEVGDGRSEAKYKRRERKEEERKENEKTAKTRRAHSVITEGSADADGKMSRANSRSGRSSGERALNRNRKKSYGREVDKRLVLNVGPNVHRFDPFDVLPVPGSSQLDTLFRLYKSGSKTNSIAINARHTWWSFISNDAGLLHATLATWALYGMLVQGLRDLQVEMLKYKNAAIREIKMKIGSPSGNISDELVGTVLTLASLENLLGAYDAAQLHIAALRRMVNARGGLFAFGHNDGLVRGMIWVDFHTAAAFHTPPSFPQIRLDPDTPPLPDVLLEHAAFTSPTSLLQLSLAAVDCFNIFYRLHRLSLAASSHWIGRVDRLTLSNLLYETEYLILCVPDYSRDFLAFDSETKDEQDERYEQRKSKADAASVVEALLASSQIFIYAALREIPPQATIFSILLDRLRIALERPHTSAIAIWKQEKNTNTLLWVLLLASSIAPPCEARTLWISRLLDTMKELNISSRTGLEQVLKLVAWTDTYFSSALNDIWDKACRLRSPERTNDLQTVTQTINPTLLDPQTRGTQVDWVYGDRRPNTPIVPERGGGMPMDGV